MKQPIRKLNPHNVPIKYQHLIPYAEEWGIIDGVVRDRYIEKASKLMLETLVAEVLPYDEILDEWLAGSEAKAESTSIEYVAFSCLRLAVDIARLKLIKMERS